jgi:hypothetical protein
MGIMGKYLYGQEFTEISFRGTLDDRVKSGLRGVKFSQC